MVRNDCSQASCARHVISEVASVFSYNGLAGRQSRSRPGSRSSHYTTAVVSVFTSHHITSHLIICFKQLTSSAQLSAQSQSQSEHLSKTTDNSARNFAEG